MVFNATFNNISTISESWQSVLLVEENLVPGEIHQSAASIYNPNPSNKDEIQKTSNVAK
jgi:hypothetical protein